MLNKSLLMFCCIASCSFLLAADKPVTIGVEAEDFQFKGSWLTLENKELSSGKEYLFAGERGAVLPAATAVKIPRAGVYHLWVRAQDFAGDRPGTRTFTMSVNGEQSKEIFGRSAKDGFNWEPGGAFDLPSGEVLLAIHDVSKAYGRVDAVLLTTDPDLKPEGKFGSRGLPRVVPVKVLASGDSAANDPLAARPVVAAADAPVATLENEFVRYQFLLAKHGDMNTIIPQVEYRQGAQWLKAEVNAADEIYAVVKSKVTSIRYSGIFPLWAVPRSPLVDVKVGDATITTARSLNPPEIWRAGDFLRFQPISAKLENDVVLLEFAPLPAGRLTAEWRLAAGGRAANVKLTFTPSEAGSYTLGYHMFFRRPLEDVQELQLPLAFQRKRFPDRAYMVLDPRMPTPLALAQVGTAERAVAWGVIGDPSEIPFAWPDNRKPNMGLCISDEQGWVQPSIYGPIPTTERAALGAGQELTFTFNVLVQPGEWYAAYRTAADEVFGLRDYRRNVNVSLSDAVYNMIDLCKDDEFGGWWQDPKGWYQVESRNTVTHSTPATMLSLYKLTGDQELYQRRVLPTLEYILSRDGFHFTPTPSDVGRYYCGPMGGPVKTFGSATYTALAALCGGYTPAFEKIALPADKKVSHTAGYSHANIFNEWAVRYRMTQNPDDLKEAMRLADEYLERSVVKPPTHPIGHTPFWLISFVPDWEGLLMMYELTDEQRYLDGAVSGARQLMVGLWTQPLFPEGDTTIFPDGSYDGDPWSGQLLGRGPEQSRLGFPLQAGALKEHKTPAWMVSCVGLGFEQPSTLGSKGNRLIYQAVWAPEFLRLARYTGDKAFETYARNATVGRWANYPGYYVAGHMDMVHDPRYPYVGPDQSVIYYHHIVPHLSWCIDYLVSEVEMLSDGKIKFPWLRENGYAFFDGRVYGHLPGEIYAEQGCRLWFNRSAVSLNNPQINTLTACNQRKFFAILCNQDKQAQRAELTLSADLLGVDFKDVTSVTVRGAGSAQQVELINGAVKLDFKPRELLVVEVAGAKIEVATHRVAEPSAATALPSEVNVELGDIKVKAVAIAVGHASWDALVWSDAGPDQTAKVTLHRLGSDGGWKVTDDNTYPFEFSLPMAASDDLLRFKVSVESKDGLTVSTETLTLGVYRK
ncbi:MAG: hypothetical protein PHO37_08570 [Kiritimatiellae bacterium]|nr:hypothetical protein [Kiritimatiellia bacterium]